MHMRKRVFIGRNQEIATLDALWGRDRAELLIVYGRRRVGKTRLLTHWLQENNVNGLYWVAQPTSTSEQLRHFSQALYQFANPDSSMPAMFTYASWEQALDQVVTLCAERRFALIIDEFTYLLHNTPEIAGLFQNMWDHVLKKHNLLLVLCGSHLGMMQRHILSYQAPLYGRASAQLHVRPLPFGTTGQYFETYDAAERVAIYAMFGGIPAYWERLDAAQSISDNIRQQLLTPNNLMQAEPRLLLSDFVRQPDNYIALFNAVANGYRTQKEITTFSGLAQGHVAKYLSVLESAGFIERRIPVTAAPNSRKSRYHICDPYLRFYYRFLAQRQSQLALGIQEPALAEIRRHLLDFIGTHTWEELGREWVLRAGAAGVLPYLPDKVGSYWDKHAQIDVVGLNRMQKTIILGECKWSPKPMGVEVFKTLAKKTDNVVPKQGRWSIYYVGLARGDWSDAAKMWCSAEASKLSGNNWKATGALAVDLNQVDEQLSGWA